MSVASGDDSDQAEYVDQDDVVEIILDEDGDQPMDEDDEDGKGDEENEDDGEPIEVEDTSIQTFPAHSPKSVFAIAAYPSAPLAVSGGEDDNGYLWDTVSGEALQKLDGHSDSVVAVGFSHDGSLVATGGMDGRVRVWRKGERRTWQFLIQLEGVDEVVVRTHGYPDLYFPDLCYAVVKMASTWPGPPCRWTGFHSMDVPAPFG